MAKSGEVLAFAVLAMMASLLFSCTSDIESADEILARARGSSSSDGSSASVVQGVSSGGSSSSVVEVLSSSLALPSSSSAEPSSSGTVTSSSSVEQSSSSAEPSSSSIALGSSSSAIGMDLCADFVDGTVRNNHYGKDKPQFCDERDGKKYVYVTINTQIWMANTQIWMAENLNYNASGSKCYDNLDSNCDTYGRLYDWATAMNNSASSNAVPSKIQGVCPAGWHLPSDAEWDVLVTYAGGSSTAGTKLKATSGWYNNGNGTDEYGFSALPGGNGISSGSFDHVGDNGNWWSATEYASNAYYWNMGYYSANVYRINLDKSNLYSVRCVQD